VRSSWPLSLLITAGSPQPSVALLRVEGTWCFDQNPSGSFTKIAVIRPGAIALLMTRRLFTPLGTP
jgi:hypothetical protein